MKYLLNIFFLLVVVLNYAQDAEQIGNKINSLRITEGYRNSDHDTLVMVKKLADQLLELNAENLTALLVRGEVLVALDEIEEAEKDLLAALKVDPNSLLGNFNLGALYNNIGTKKKKNGLESASKEYYLKAVEYLKITQRLISEVGAYEVDEYTVLSSLRNVYIHLEDLENYKKVNQQLESLGY